MQYQIKAVNGSQAIVALTLDAPTPHAARQAAEQQGLRVLALRPARALPALGLFFGQRGAEFPLVLFSQELGTLLNAGLPLVSAIESLAEKETDGGTRKVLADLTRLLREGKSFSQALAAVPSAFPELYVALVQSSERTGGLGAALGRYVAYRTRVEQLRQSVVSASVYPALLLVVGAGVLLFLLGYVVPRFSMVFGDMGERLPWLSRVLLRLGQGLHEHMGVLALTAACVLLALVAVLRLPSVRRALGRGLESIPAVRNRLFLYQLARLYRSLGILLQGGIPILTAIDMTRGLLGATLRARLDEAALRVREGLPLSRAFEQHQLATNVALRMLHAGEQSGRLGAMLEQTADFYDEEFGRWIGWFVRLFEPLLMVFVGALIGVVVILMYLPIFELAGSMR